MKRCHGRRAWQGLALAAALLPGLARAAPLVVIDEDDMGKAGLVRDQDILLLKLSPTLTLRVENLEAKTEFELCPVRFDDNGTVRADTSTWRRGLAKVVARPDSHGRAVVSLPVPETLGLAPGFYAVCSDASATTGDLFSRHFLASRTSSVDDFRAQSGPARSSSNSNNGVNTQWLFPHLQATAVLVEPIGNECGVGLGFIINREGWIVTAAHVLRNKTCNTTLANVRIRPEALAFPLSTSVVQSNSPTNTGAPASAPTSVVYETYVARLGIVTNEAGFPDSHELDTQLTLLVPKVPRTKVPVLPMSRHLIIKEPINGDLPHNPTYKRSYAVVQQASDLVAASVTHAQTDLQLGPMSGQYSSRGLSEQLLLCRPMKDGASGAPVVDGVAYVWGVYMGLQRLDERPEIARTLDRCGEPPPREVGVAHPAYDVAAKLREIGDRLLTTSP